MLFQSSLKSTCTYVCFLNDYCVSSVQRYNVSEGYTETALRVLSRSPIVVYAMYRCDFCALQGSYLCARVAIPRAKKIAGPPQTASRVRRTKEDPRSAPIILRDDFGMLLILFVLLRPM